MGITGMLSEKNVSISLLKEAIVVPSTTLNGKRK